MIAIFFPKEQKFFLKKDSNCVKIWQQLETNCICVNVLAADLKWIPITFMIDKKCRFFCCKLIQKSFKEKSEWKFCHSFFFHNFLVRRIEWKRERKKVSEWERECVNEWKWFVYVFVWQQQLKHDYQMTEHGAKFVWMTKKCFLPLVSCDGLMCDQTWYISN